MVNRETNEDVKECLFGSRLIRRGCDGILSQ